MDVVYVQRRSSWLQHEPWPVAGAVEGREDSQAALCHPGKGRDGWPGRQQRR